MTADKSCATCTHANSDMICVNLNSEQCGQAVCERDSCEKWKGEEMSEIENSIRILRDSNAKLKQCMGETLSEVYAIDGYEALEKCQAEYDAVELAIQALQEKLDRENPQSLSLEQLPERKGKPVWICVDDRLPEYRESVLFCVPMPLKKNRYQRTGFWNGEQFCYFGMNHEESLRCGKATHWQPLPEPPKEQTP